jgi:hypothetical protein
MKYDRLVAFGCSHTFGHGLLDCYDPHDITGPGNKPSNVAWPAMLAKKLNLQCINISRPGSSNKEIWYNIVNFNFKPGDLVFILWTTAWRHCIIKKDKIYDVSSWCKNKAAKSYYKHVFNEYDANVGLNMKMSYVDYYLKNRKIKFYQLLYDSYDYEQLSFNNNSSIIPLSMHEYLENYPKAIDNMHAGEFAHSQFATDIYKQIRENL